MPQHRTLGQTGGTGGVNHIGNAVRFRPVDRRCILAALPDFSEAVPGNDKFCIRIIQHIADPLLRIVGIDRDIGRARFLDSQHGGDKLLHTPHFNGNKAVFFDSLLQEPCGKTVGDAVKFPIAHAAGAVDHGSFVRIPACVLPEEIHPGLTGIIDQRFSPGQCKDFLLLFPVQHGDVLHLLSRDQAERCLSDGGGQRLHVCPAVTGSVIFQRDDIAVFRRTDGDGNREFGSVKEQRDGLKPVIRIGGVLYAVLKTEEDFRLNPVFFHQPGVGIVLSGNGLLQLLINLSDIVGRRPVSVFFALHHRRQCLDKHSRSIQKLRIRGSSVADGGKKHLFLPCDPL